jgi:hypothetical protein
MAIFIEPIQVRQGPIDQWKIACFASRRSGVQIPFGPLILSWEKSEEALSPEEGIAWKMPARAIKECAKCDAICAPAVDTRVNRKS